METCLICNKIYKNVNSLRIHIKKIHGILFKDYKKKYFNNVKFCKYCGINISHKPINSIKCDSKDCDLKFKKEQKILKENKKYRITINYKGFKTTEAFNRDIWQNL